MILNVKFTYAHRIGHFDQLDIDIVRFLTDEFGAS